MVILGDGISRTEPFAASLTVTEGTLYMISTNRLTTTTAVTSKPYAVATEDDLDSAGTARTTTAGDRLNVALIGSGEIVMVKSITAQTYAKGAAVYVTQTAGTDGQVETDTSNSAVKMGHYVGAGEVTSGVTKIKVILDVANAS